ncbi:MAG TPA: prenyltransferase [Nannocystaceae bacterium]|nr:prenyltransferase [Nannocystaceae bacterium]
MQPRRWLEAVRVIPRIDKQEWQELDPIARWLVATRAAVLIMTLISATIAGLLAARVGRFDALLWTLVAIGLVFAHATNNLVNDLTDHIKGVDRGDYFRAQYGPQPLEHGLMSRAAMVRLIVITGAVALAAGVALIGLRGGATLVLMASGVFFVLFYTWPLKYIGLGELAVIVVWGPLMVGGGYYVITGSIDTTVVLAGLPFSIGATTVIFGKHIDKLPQDRAKGIRTLPVLLGDRISRASVLVMLALQYGIVFQLVLGGRLGPALLVVLGATTVLPRTIRAYRSPRPAEPPAKLPKGIWPLWFVAFAFDHNRRFGVLYVLGLAIDVLLHRLGEAPVLA